MIAWLVGGFGHGCSMAQVDAPSTMPMTSNCRRPTLTSYHLANRIRIV
jgi:hypothetical protein